jgi:hypothetical protein
MADPLDMLAKLGTLIGSVPDLKNRIEQVADLAELIKRGALPNTPVTAYLVPTGLRPRSEGDAGAGYFTQSVDEHFAIVLVLRTAADVTGAKGLPKLNKLVWQVIEAVAGSDAPDAVGVFRFGGGQLHSLTAGALIYQVNFSIQLQIRNL